MQAGGNNWKNQQSVRFHRMNLQNLLEVYWIS